MRYFVGTLCVWLLLCPVIQAQNVGINDDNSSPDSSAMLDVSSATRGLLIPRVALKATDSAAPVIKPVTSLLVYNTATSGDVTPGYYFWNGTAWVPLVTSASNLWMRNGDSIYTLNSGSVGIGVSTFDTANPEKLLVDAGVTESVNAIYARGTVDNYFQVNIRNLSDGEHASSDLVATADNGTETTNYIDLGINGSRYVYGPGNPILTGAANDCYLLGSGENLLLVNSNPNKDMVFMTGGTDTTNERMRITNFGKIGVGTGKPTARLHIIGQLDEPQFKVQAFSSQTSDILQLWDPAAETKYVTVDHQGRMIIGGPGGAVGGNNLLTVNTSTHIPEYTEEHTIVEFDSEDPEKKDFIFRLSEPDNLGSPEISLAKSRGSLESPSNLVQNDVIGGFMFLGYAGGQWNDISQITGLYRGDGTTRTGDLRFQTTNGSDLETRMTIAPEGHIGIGTDAPGNMLEINQGSAGNSGLRFTQMASSSTPSTANGKVLSLNANGDVIMTLNDAISLPLSGIMAATGTNTADHLNYTQAWNWSTAATENPFTLSGNALTSGDLFSL
ncbi:MAG TPA: hypothetical protein PLK82_07415, partial [Bacteroidales bacterium]|nr:hypothetical protein [Bacteroidales bacterium]